MSRKKIIGGAAAAALAAMAVVTVSTVNKPIKIPYEVEENEYSAYMTLDVPTEIGADMTELYANEELVCRAVMPNGRLETVPVLYKDLAELTLKLYKRGAEIGEAEFSKGELLFKGELK